MDLSDKILVLYLAVGAENYWTLCFVPASVDPQTYFSVSHIDLEILVVKSCEKHYQVVDFDDLEHDIWV
jgi:hypothetical protein